MPRLSCRDLAVLAFGDLSVRRSRCGRCYCRRRPARIRPVSEYSHRASLVRTLWPRESACRSGECQPLWRRCGISSLPDSALPGASGSELSPNPGPSAMAVFRLPLLSMRINSRMMALKMMLRWRLKRVFWCFPTFVDDHRDDVARRVCGRGGRCKTTRDRGGARTRGDRPGKSPEAAGRWSWPRDLHPHRRCQNIGNRVFEPVSVRHSAGRVSQRQRHGSRDHQLLPFTLSFPPPLWMDVRLTAGRLPDFHRASGRRRRRAGGQQPNAGSLPGAPASSTSVMLTLAS